MSGLVVEVKRNGRVESVHRVLAAVADSQGNVRNASGDVSTIVFPRSALKPYQLLPLVASGAADEYAFTDEELAVAAGSHNGEAAHVKTVLGMLEKLGLSEKDLKCGAHAPYHKRTAATLGANHSSIHHNCSGKHAGMLALAKHLGVPVKDYLDPASAGQVAIHAAITACTGLGSDGVVLATDGCSAPAHAFPLDRVARLYALLARPDDAPAPYASALGRISHAMRAQPYYVAGSESFDTDLMDSGEFLVSKAGAEGVQCVADLSSGLGLAVKIVDGASRAAAPAAIEACRQLSWLDLRAFETLGDQWRPAIMNHAGRVVGALEATGELTAQGFSVGD